MKHVSLVVLILLLCSCADNAENVVDENSKEQENEQEVKSEVDVNYIDGSPIKYVVIGDQVWTATNLRVSKFSNGESIELASDSKSWKNANRSSKSAYSKPVKGPQDNINGYLYNGYAAISANKLCPKGWHIPTDEDFVKLIDYVGDKPGKKLKGRSGWMEAAGDLGGGDGNGTDNYGFNALPVGGVSAAFMGGGYGRDTPFLTSTERGRGSIFYKFQNYTVDIIDNNGDLGGGGVCRCVKDNSDISDLPSKNKVVPSKQKKEKVHEMNEYEAAEMGDEAEY